jgi:uncharacterized protein
LISGRTALHWACKKGERALVLYLIQKGADVNCLQNDGQSPLHLAARQGHSEILTTLLQHGADIMKEDLQHRLPIEYAIANNNNSKFLTIFKKNCLFFNKILRRKFVKFIGTQV